MALMLALTVQAEIPRLTVCIVVDGLRQDNLELLRPYWSQGGLRTLQEEGYQTSFAIPHAIYGGDETTATLLTGVLPREHGYSMDRYFRRSDRSVQPLLQDETVTGIGTAKAYSPRALLAPSLTDRLRLMAGKQARIYAVGLRPETTVLMAGHCANACCWIDAEQRRWVSTSYYDEGLPDEADQMNVSGRFEQIMQREWTPRLNISSYTSPTDEERKRPFAYRSEEVLLHSPAANELVVELALELQRSKHLGVDATPDMLLLQLTTLSPKAQSDRILSAEQEDLHLWLNQDIGFLMEQLDKRLGAENYQILVVGRPVYGIGTAPLSDAGLTVSQFNVDRAAALACTYLMALYGHERWVDGGYGQSIYLNRALIERKQMSMQTIQQQLAAFLMDFEGVQFAFPPSDVPQQPELFPSYTKRCFGDVLFTLQPGWQMTANDKVVPLLYLTHAVSTYPQQPVTALDLHKLLKTE